MPYKKSRRSDVGFLCDSILFVKPFQQFFQPVPDPREEGDYRKVFAERQDQRFVEIEEDELRLKEHVLVQAVSSQFNVFLRDRRS